MPKRWQQHNAFPATVLRLIWASLTQIAAAILDQTLPRQSLALRDAGEALKIVPNDRPS